ncbi:RNA polymerase II transcription factor B subunit 4 [Sparassis crispa]|uniref:General transcription and DNA repair factor IIH subunit TFB4 n=1 Tax=Sparassis crispa TaxID=139825 RepID=A0A401GG00_9APHY|nr:RNA polymerase II transcription factor B subunit 4 [Sparassis crispa]GBE81114.1 RNA polymerase II transcription factor B subunit 4 [Sparassis crispa]
MDKASHLSVILDLSPSQWFFSAQLSPVNPHPLTLKSFISQLLVFLNSHIACKDENTLAVFGALPGRSVMLYASANPVAEEHVEVADANTFRPFKILDSTVVQSILDQLDALGDPEEEAPIGLVGALTKSLCYINRITSPSSSSPARTDEQAPVDPRILVLSVSPDQSSSYIPIMNSIFSAQKLRVTIDVCTIYGPDSVFLQQAAHLTGGSYMRLDRPDALLQYLIMSFLPPPATRQLLSVPTQDKIDFRAACFCHKRIIDIGFVCSVCLSIFCQPVPVCSTCRTKFPIKTLQRLNASRPTAIPSPPRNTSAPAQSLPPNTLGSSHLIGQNGAART